MYVFVAVGVFVDQETKRIESVLLHVSKAKELIQFGTNV